MKNFYGLNTLMPQKNCGHCGWPSCSAMTRRMTTGEAEPSDCIYLGMPEFSENKSKIQSLLKEGIKIGIRMPTSSEKVTLIRPCTTESGKVTATARLVLPTSGKELKYGFFDPFTLCDLLKNYPSFDDIKCSEKMSIARIGIDGKSILVFGNGKIKVRKARDKEDVHASINLISKIMWGAIICPDCGCDAIDCASGGCQKCSDPLKSVLNALPVIDSDKTPTRRKVKGIKIAEKLESIKTNDKFMEGMKTLDTAVTDFKKSTGKEVDLEDFSNRMKEISIDYIIKTEKIEDAVFGIVMMGITRDLKRAIEAATTVDRNEHVKEVVELIADAYSAFKNSDLKKGKEIEERYQILSEKITELKDKEGSKPGMLEIEKIARNGRNIAKILELKL